MLVDCPPAITITTFRRYIMTREELISRLNKFNPDAEIKIIHTGYRLSSEKKIEINSACFALEQFKQREHTLMHRANVKPQDYAAKKQTVQTLLDAVRLLPTGAALQLSIQDVCYSFTCGVFHVAIYDSTTIHFIPRQTWLNMKDQPKAQ